MGESAIWADLTTRLAVKANSTRAIMLTVAIKGLGPTRYSQVGRVNKHQMAADVRWPYNYHQ